MSIELINESGLFFADISSEEWREYVFRDGEALVIKEPLRLNVSRGGAHRILDASGASHYVPPGWLHLTWRAKAGSPHFVDVQLCDHEFGALFCWKRGIDKLKRAIERKAKARKTGGGT